MHKYGYKLLRDDRDYYLCLLQIDDESKVIANDIKYRTDKVFIIDIRRISNLSKVKSVNHISFYNSIDIIKYQVNNFIKSNLDTSINICGEGIHYFPLFGSTPIHFVHYFSTIPTFRLDCDKMFNIGNTFENILHILDIWILQQVPQQVAQQVSTEMLYLLTKKLN